MEVKRVGIDSFLKISKPTMQVLVDQEQNQV